MWTPFRAGLVAAALVVVAVPLFLRTTPVSPRLTLQPAQLAADGYDTATLLIETRSAAVPEISINSRAARVEEISREPNGWRAEIRSGVVPGRVAIQVQFPHVPAALAELTTTLSAADRFDDGTPDFLRLDESDERAFRRWFTYLAEVQYFTTGSNRPAEIQDCAALIRYAYREAVHAHDSAWAQAARLEVVPPFDSVVKYQYPYTPLGAALFRVVPGPFRPSDLDSRAFAQFADAQTLRRWNTHFVSRDLALAQPGDLLFFRHESEHLPFHSMIYLGASQVRDDGRRYVIYHTGPESGKVAGEIRRWTVEELLRYPQSEWRPLPVNPGFLGVYRWNILRKPES